MKSKMDVVRFLRKCGYTVVFHPTEKETLLVTAPGETSVSRSYIKIVDLRTPQIRDREHNWDTKGRYVLTKPATDGAYKDYDYCFLIMNEKPEKPVYTVGLTGVVTRSPQVTETLRTKYPLKFIGFLHKINPSHTNNWKTIPRVNGKFVARGGEIYKK